MAFADITYNGYKFPDRSNFEIKEEYLYDDAEVTVIATQFHLQVSTIIVADPSPYAGTDYTDKAYNCGPEMHRVRQLLSKAGKTLEIKHDGFGPDNPYPLINGSSNVKDVRFGPKPKMISWVPVGNTACVEVIWQCTFAVPICDGTSSPRFDGLCAFNYALTYDIDKRGFTTRKIAGYIEVAMTRIYGDRTLPDSVDLYRNKVQFYKPANFERVVSWNVSLDKRRADFTITDTEIASNNPYPAGVVAISARHRGGWSKRNRTQISNTINATIELSPLENRFRAWYIFRAIVNARLAYAQSVGIIYFIDSFDVDEELFENRISFNLSYRLLSTPGYYIGLLNMFNATGLMQPLSTQNDGTWQQWSESLSQLNPLQGKSYDRGIAKLEHDYYGDRIIDLCMNERPSPRPEDTTRGVPPPTAIQTFCNPKPPADKSWKSFNADFVYDEHSYAFDAVTLGPDDLRNEEFDPRKPDANLPETQQDEIKRYLENHAGIIGLRWQGVAERVGYPIPRPGKITIGDMQLVPAGKGKFKQGFVGNYFCQPLYKAMWDIPYKLQKRPRKIDGVEASKIAVPENEA